MPQGASFKERVREKRVVRTVNILLVVSNKTYYLAFNNMTLFQYLFTYCKYRYVDNGIRRLELNQLNQFL